MTWLYLIGFACFIFVVETLVLSIAIGSVVVAEWWWGDPEMESLLQREVMLKVMKAHLSFRSKRKFIQTFFAVPFWLTMPFVSLFSIWLSIYSIQFEEVS